MTTQRSGSVCASRRDGKARTRIARTANSRVEKSARATACSRCLPPAFGTEHRHDRVLRPVEIGEQQGETQLSFIKAVPRRPGPAHMGSDFDGAIGKSLPTREPLCIAGCAMQIEKRISASRISAAKIDRARTRLPRV